MHKEQSLELEYDEQDLPQEDGVEIPLDRISQETLRNLISEFVTRQWEETGDAAFTLEEMIGQVQRQLQENKARVVFDLRSNTANIIVNR